MAEIRQGFNPNFIIGGGNNLNRLLQPPSNQILDKANLNQRATEQAFQSNQLLGLQREQQFNNTLLQADQLGQQVLARSSQQGIGAGAFSDFQNQQVNQDIARTKEFTREAQKSLLGEERALNIENFKSRISQKGFQQIDRQFSRQMQEFERGFAKYQRTTRAKFGTELRKAREVQQQRSQQAWERLALGLERKKKGGSIVGGIAGGLLGGLAFAGTGFANIGFLTGGVSLGRGIGGAIGTGIGQRNAQRQLGGF